MRRTSQREDDALTARGAHAPESYTVPGGVQCPCVSARQPLAQQAGRVRRRRGRRTASARWGRPVSARCPPAVLADRRDFDEVYASGDTFFETMDGSGHCSLFWSDCVWELPNCMRLHSRDQGKRRTEGMARRV